MTWIRVTERLPAYYKNVLVVIEPMQTIDIEPLVCEAWRKKNEAGHDDWVVCDRCGDLVPFEVTHWSELPVAPGAEDRKDFIGWPV